MILITGINSFVGSHLAKELIRKNLKFIGVDLNLKENKYCKKIDIRDKKIEKYITPQSTIIHLAALSTDKLCKEKPNLAFDVNINGTINLINIAKNKKIKKFIFASTEWVYGNFTKKIQSESDEIKIESLDSLYAITKAVGERLLLSKINKFKKIILRFGIIYGNRHQNLSALESIFLNCLKNKHVILGSKKTSRRFIHIDDVVSGIMEMLKYKKDEIFNLSGSRNITLEDIVQASSKILEKKIKIIEKDSSILSVRQPSNSKLKMKTNWHPKVRLTDGILQLKKYWQI